MSNTHYYAGEQQDPTGLYYDRARYYNPTTGRFIGEDSVGGNGAMPASMNRYTYAQNAPATYTDPTGHDVWSNIDKMVSNYLQGVGVNTLHGLANVATRLGGGGLLALNGFNSNRAAAQLGQWAQNNPILAWAVVNANSLGYRAAVDTLSSYTNLIPVFGQAKMLSEGLAGQDLFSGRQLGSFERAGYVLAGGVGLFVSGWTMATGELAAGQSSLTITTLDTELNRKAEGVTGGWLSGQLTPDEKNLLIDLAANRKGTELEDVPIVLSGSLSEPLSGIVNRYDPEYQSKLPPFRRTKPNTTLIDDPSGIVRDVDFWEGSLLTSSEKAKVGDFFARKYPGVEVEIDEGYKLQYYPTLESLSTGVSKVTGELEAPGGLAFYSSRRIVRYPASWQRP